MALGFRPLPLALQATSFALTAAVGTFTLTGQSTVWNVSNLDDIGSFNFNGQSVTLGPAQVATVTTFSLTGQSITTNVTEIWSTGTYSFTGVAIVENVTLLNPSKGTFVLTGQDVTLTTVTRKRSYAYIYR